MDVAEEESEGGTDFDEAQPNGPRSRLFAILCFASQHSEISGRSLPSVFLSPLPLNEEITISSTIAQFGQKETGEQLFTFGLRDLD